MKKDLKQILPKIFYDGTNTGAIDAITKLNDKYDLYQTIDNI